jgi:hypothetical protein
MNDMIDYIYEILINPSYVLFALSISQILLLVEFCLLKRKIEKGENKK